MSENNDSPKSVQVIERTAPKFDGGGHLIETQLRLEVLREGEVITKPDGHRVQIVRNELGTLYEKSLEPQVGAAGVSTPVAPQDFVEAVAEKTLQQIGEDPLERMKGLIENLENLEKLQEGNRNLSPVGLLTVHDITPLYLKYFNAEARLLLGRIQKTAIAQHTSEAGLTLQMGMVCAVVRVADPAKREASVQALISVLNWLSAMGLIRSYLCTLSSMTVPFYKLPENISFLEAVKQGVADDYHEIVFAFPHVTSIDACRALFPQFIFDEGKTPEKPFEPSEFDGFPKQY